MRTHHGLRPGAAPAKDAGLALHLPAWRTSPWAWSWASWRTASTSGPRPGGPDFEGAPHGPARRWPGSRRIPRPRPARGGLAGQHGHLRRRQGEELDALYDRMLALRHRQAVNAGFQRYTELRFQQFGRFDYTPQDCLDLHQALAATAMPLARRVNALRERGLGLDAGRATPLGPGLGRLVPGPAAAAGGDAPGRWPRVWPASTRVRCPQDPAHFPAAARTRATWTWRTGPASAWPASAPISTAADPASST